MDESTKKEILEALKASEDRVSLMFDKLLDIVGKVVRRQDEVVKTISLVYEDRNILEDIQTSITALREGIHINREHQDRVVKDVKAEVIERGIEVKEKVANVEKRVEEKVGEMANTATTLLNGVAKAVEKNDGVVERNWLKKILKLFRNKGGDRK